MVANPKLVKMVVLCLVVALCIALVGCGPKDIEPVVDEPQSELSMAPEGLGKLDARLFYIRSKYGLSSEEAQAKMDASYKESGFTEVAWNNYRKWLERQGEDIIQAHDKAKKEELAKLRKEGLE